MRRSFFLAFMALFFFKAGGSLSWAQSLQNPIAILSGLDKITGQTKNFEVPLGTRVSFGTLSITVRACLTQPVTEPPKTLAFLDISERQDHKDGDPLFSGWMLAESPALNPLEHPVYDLWLTGCKDPKKPANTPTPPPLLPDNTMGLDHIPKDNE